MLTRKHSARPPACGGFTLIEVLVTIALMLIGLLGVLGMQAKASVAEFESYQRGEALNLARDMQARLQNSRSIVTGYLDNAVSSVDGTVYVGTGVNAKNFANGAGACVPGGGVALAEAEFEMCQWAQALQGASVKDGTANVGAMLNAQGCLVRVVPPENNALADVFVTIVWQGSTPGTEPDPDSPAGKNYCAKDVNFGVGLRRGITLRVLVPDLAKAS
jgi:type IV pilus assembly protein PilV